MDSPFTLTIDWLAFTVLAATAEETMRILGGDWSKAKAGFRGYPLPGSERMDYVEWGNLGHGRLVDLMKSTSICREESSQLSP